MLVLFTSIIILSFSIQYSVASYLTFAQRHRLLTENRQKLMAALYCSTDIQYISKVVTECEDFLTKFSTVSYKKHVWYIATFRDASKLYR
jgi:hypothetical protein